MTRESELISLKEINFDSKNNFYVDPQTNNLIIKSVAMEDSGFYLEIIYEKTLLKEYHLTILNSPIRIPVLENYTNTGNKLAWFNKSVKLINTNIETITIWNDWSECACVALGNKTSSESYRIRYGNCHVRLIDRKQKMLDSKKFKRIFNILSQYNN